MRTWTLRLLLLGVILVLSLSLAACSDDDDAGDSGDSTTTDDQSAAPAEERDATTMTLQLTSTAFEEGAAIPARYTCTGDDISPALAWTGAPDGTASFVLIMDDPDAPSRTWVHWVVYNLPPNITDLPEAIAADDDLPGDAAHAQNSWRRSDYGGPCPPSGTHRYFFKLYALDTTLNLGVDATKSTVVAAMEGHILAEAQLMGTYEK